MRKGCNRNKGGKTPPMLVMRGIRNDEIETRERAAVQAFLLGFATEAHYDVLTDMQGVMILAGSTSAARRPAMIYAKEVIGKTLSVLKDRYLQTGKFECTEDDEAALKGFVTQYRNFWLRQPLGLYEAATASLQDYYDKVAAQRRNGATQ